MSTWLYRITVNTCFSMKRKKAVSEMRTEENMEEIMSASPFIKNESLTVSPERSTESVLIKKNIEIAMSTLSKREKSVFVLRNYNDLPFDEIVEILNLKPGTVRSLNFRAIKKLRKALSFYKYEFQTGE